MMGVMVLRCVAWVIFLCLHSGETEHDGDVGTIVCLCLILDYETMMQLAACH